MPARRGGSKNNKLKDMNNNIIINEALKLLDEGFSVTLPVAGHSMLPFIIGDKESVILAKPQTLSPGIIALAWVEQRRFVLHRIEKIECDNVTLMGDGNLAGREHCRIADVKAIATHVVDRHKHNHDLYTPQRRMAAKIWYKMLPIRRYLLAIYHIFC